MYEFLFGNSGGAGADEMSQWMEVSEGISSVASYLILLAFSVITYIFQSRAMFAIAKRRGIDKPWLAWVPIGSSWMMGCISDQYRYVARGETKNKRTVLLSLEIVVMVAALLMYGLAVWELISVINAGVAGDYAQMLNTAITGSVGILFLLVVLLGVSLGYSVVFYFALWDYYQSCNPQRSVMFFLLSILVSYPRPFLMFICRDKDLGMPPRREALPEYEPVYEPPTEE